jgi:hypothetical protein
MDIVTLSHFLAGRKLWEVDEVDAPSATVDDFFIANGSRPAYRFVQHKFLVHKSCHSSVRAVQPQASQRDRNMHGASLGSEKGNLKNWEGP